MTAPILSIREATEADLRFVRASWFESYRNGGYAPQVAFPTYREGQHQIIERCLKLGRTFVAFVTSVPDEVCSWVCVQAPSLLHFAYTKQAYRRMGIAKQLLTEAARSGALQEHTHDTRVGRSLAAKIGTKHNPYPLYPPAVPRSHK